MIVLHYVYSRSKRFQTSVVDCLSFVMVQDPVNREGWTADDVSEGLKCEWANCYHWKRCPEFLWQDESDSTPEALETDKEVKRSHKFWQLTSKMITRWWSAQLNSVFLNCKNWKILLQKCSSIIRWFGLTRSVEWLLHVAGSGCNRNWGPVANHCRSH